MFWETPVETDRAALWFLGQSGFYLKSGDRTVLIDPYLSDSVGESDPLFQRRYPPPVLPAQLEADLILITHNHLDHLDPQTLTRLPCLRGAGFAAPRQAATALERLGVPRENITVIDHGDRAVVRGVEVSGIFALATGADVLDTTGYLIRFENGKTAYHTSDTAFCELLLDAAPHADVLLTCINGKFGNLGVEQAVRLAGAVCPAYVIPHHYDVMERNGENPEAFRYFCRHAKLSAECVVLEPLQKWVW